jgi:protein-disulfide isomerase
MGFSVLFLVNPMSLAKIIYGEDAACSSILNVRSVCLAAAAVVLGAFVTSTLLFAEETAAPQTVSSTRTDAEIEAIVRRVIENDPGFVLSVIQKHMQAEQARDQADKDKLVFENHDAIVETSKLPFIGPADGIEIIEFMDVNCGYCKRIYPVIKEFAADNPDVKIVHREIPILGPNSRLSASVSEILWAEHPGLYGEYHDRIMTQRSSSTPGSIGAVLDVIVGDEKAQEILRRARAADDAGFVAGNLDIARNSGITGTPYVYVPGVKLPIRGAVPDLRERLQAAIDVLRKQRASGD